MRRLLTILASSAVFSSALLAITAGEARADEAQPAGAATPSTPNEKPQPKDADDDIKHIALEVNPLGLAIGRYSISAEYLLAKHHALTLSPFSANAPVTATINGKEIDGGALTGFGGELGYRALSLPAAASVRAFCSRSATRSETGLSCGGVRPFSP